MGGFTEGPANSPFVDEQDVGDTTCSSHFSITRGKGDVAMSKANHGQVSPPLPLPFGFTLLPCRLPGRHLTPLLYTSVVCPPRRILAKPWVSADLSERPAGVYDDMPLTCASCLAPPYPARSTSTGHTTWCAHRIWLVERRIQPRHRRCGTMARLLGPARYCSSHHTESRRRQTVLGCGSQGGE